METIKKMKEKGNKLKRRKLNLRRRQKKERQTSSRADMKSQSNYRIYKQILTRLYIQSKALMNLDCTSSLAIRTLIQSSESLEGDIRYEIPETFQSPRKGITPPRFKSVSSLVSIHLTQST